MENLVFTPVGSKRLVIKGITCLAALAGFALAAVSRCAHRNLVPEGGLKRFGAFPFMDGRNQALVKYEHHATGRRTQQRKSLRLCTLASLR